MSQCRAGGCWWDRGQGSLVSAVPVAASPCWFPWAVEVLEQLCLRAHLEPLPELLGSSDPGELLALHPLSRPNSISEPPGIFLQLHPSGCPAPETGMWLLLVSKDMLGMGRGRRGWAGAAGGFPEAFPALCCPALSEEVGAGGCEVKPERLKWLFLEFHRREEELGAQSRINEGKGSIIWRNKDWAEAPIPTEGTAVPGRGNQGCRLRLDAWKNLQLLGQCPRWGEGRAGAPRHVGLGKHRVPGAGEQVW